ncbi:hypothetical protein [Bacillus sp. FJAT-47783]|uniref:hypothetical protein n=1 Tax=Bacillus sp. FJAT-47783 TaxID=2922712 RepID=UPI001FAD245B|nr:hypothetical protein [Bacillus sp. FJAT-47783]
MDVFAQLIGTGPGGVQLLAEVVIDISGDGTCADFTVTNKSQNGLIDQFLFNLNSDFDSTIAGELDAMNVNPMSWTFEDSSGPPPNGFDFNSGGCGRYQYRIMTNVNADRLAFNESLTFTLCSTDPAKTFDVNTFLNAPNARIGNTTLPFQLAVSYQAIQPGDQSACIAGNFSTESPPPPPPVPDECPIAHPQVCCQVAVEFKSQLVPPALIVEDGETFQNLMVEIPEMPVIEAVCPEKVIVCGKIRKTLQYIGILEDGTPEVRMLTDERPFQCIIDTEDANEGEEDLFRVVGAAVLCEGTPRGQNIGTRPGQSPCDEPVDVFWKVLEKDIIKVCIRKIPPPISNS